MLCACCGKKLANGMIRKRDTTTGEKYKSCPHCSDANGKEHVLHKYPQEFGKTSARITAKNPDGYQSYCISCRRLTKGESSHNYTNGRACSSLK
tara:strand:+ start:974 stop:1255 length:282 start_codon:yes stop_codon:yes gene_type:complete